MIESIPLILKSIQIERTFQLKNKIFDEKENYKKSQFYTNFERSTKSSGGSIKIIS